MSTRLASPDAVDFGRGLGLELDGRRVRPTGIIHVGGHHGEEAGYYQAHGARTVVWIEAEPDAFEVLQQSVRGYAGHHCIEALAGEEDGAPRPFYRRRFPGGTKRGFSSALPWNQTVLDRDPMLSRLETIEVRPMWTVTVATALRSWGFAPCDFQYLSVNVQGAELLVLRGMGEFLDAVQWIFCDGELDSASTRYAGAPTIREVEAWLRPRGFRAAWPPPTRQQLFFRPATVERA